MRAVMPRVRQGAGAKLGRIKDSQRQPLQASETGPARDRLQAHLDEIEQLVSGQVTQQDAAPLRNDRDLHPLNLLQQALRSTLGGGVRDGEHAIVDGRSGDRHIAKSPELSWCGAGRRRGLTACHAIPWCA